MEEDDFLEQIIEVIKYTGSLIYYIFTILGYYNDFMIESIIVIINNFLEIKVMSLLYFLGLPLFSYCFFMLLSFFIYNIKEPEVDLTRHVEILVDNYENPNKLVQTKAHFWVIVFFLVVYEIFNFVVLYKITCLCLRFDSDHIVVFLCNNSGEV